MQTHFDQNMRILKHMGMFVPAETIFFLENDQRQNARQWWAYLNLADRNRVRV